MKRNEEPRVHSDAWPAATRREFIRRLTIAPAALAGLARSRAEDQPSRRVRFGVMADLHTDLMPDGVERLRAFVTAMEASRTDFVLQLGDFCWPMPGNQSVLEAWNRFGSPRFHVLGNHDMDGGHTREHSAGFFGMPAKYYAFAAGPIRGLVLDGNEPGGQAAGYKRFVGAEQLGWLERELARADRPTVLFIHQPFDADHDGCLENSAAVRAVVERAESTKPGSVVAVFSGHLHVDGERTVNGIRYLQINSASYWWLNNAAARRETYPPEVHQAYPYLTHVAAYRDPLWAMVTIDLERGELVLEGRRTEWVGPDPWQRGETTPWSREQVRPGVSDRRLTLRSLGLARVRRAAANANLPL
ncbi:MAG: metallophosphoesterase family protein [Limisphaerales bacterium]